MTVPRPRSFEFMARREPFAAAKGGVEWRLFVRECERKLNMDWNDIRRVFDSYDRGPEFVMAFSGVRSHRP